MTGSAQSAVNGVGESALRFDAPGKVTGATAYPGDRSGHDALVAKLVFTNQPHARLLSLGVDQARAVSGVVAVFTAADVPVNEYGLSIFDQPVFIGLEHTGRSDVSPEISRWEADNLALVVAETRCRYPQWPRLPSPAKVGRPANTRYPDPDCTLRHIIEPR